MRLRSFFVLVTLMTLAASSAEARDPFYIVVEDADGCMVSVSGPCDIIFLGIPAIRFGAVIVCGQVGGSSPDLNYGSDCEDLGTTYLA